MCLELLSVFALIVLYVALWSASLRLTIEGKVSKIENTCLKTIIYFSDGRYMTFNSVPRKPLTLGEYYVITYNGFGEIFSIKQQ